MTIVQSEAVKAEQAAETNVFVARQPIFRSNSQLHGYELLYRSGADNRFDGTAPDVATARVIANTFLNIGANKLLNGKPAFINFAENMLTMELASLLPFRAVVVEILESVEPTPEVLRACHELKKRGYALALDDVGDTSNIEPWIGLVDIIKVDFLKTGGENRRHLVRRYRRGKVKLLAEKLENQAEFNTAIALGYDLHQGFFFARPQIVSGRAIPQSKVHLLRLLREVSSEDIDLARLETLVVQEVALTYKLLRYLNSAAFGWRSPITSLRHALTLLGVEELRKWICLLLLTSMGDFKQPQTVINSLVRARYAELLSAQMGLGRRKSSAFLLGLLSQLDAILNCPLEQALSELSLEPDVVNTLLGRTTADSGLTDLYVLMTAYEAADWVRCAAIAQMHGIAVNDLSGTYVQAVNWADAVAAL